MADAVASDRVETGRWPRVREFFRAGVGKPFNGIVLLLALGTVWLWSPPAPTFLSVLVLWPWILIGLYWLFRLVGMGVVGRNPFQRPLLRIAFAPAVVLVCLGLIFFNVPAETRFQLSKGAMEEYAVRVTANPDAPIPDRVGWYQITDPQLIPEGVRFIVEGAGPIDRYGFAYSPDGPPKDRGRYHYSHVDGPWYLVREEF